MQPSSAFTLLAAHTWTFSNLPRSDHFADTVTSQIRRTLAAEGYPAIDISVSVSTFTIPGTSSGIQRHIADVSLMDSSFASSTSSDSDLSTASRAGQYLVSTYGLSARDRKCPPEIAAVRRAFARMVNALVDRAHGYDLNLADNATGYLHVSLMRDQFVARRSIKGSKILLGRFDTAVDAAVAVAKSMARVKTQHRLAGSPRKAAKDLATQSPSHLREFLASGPRHPNTVASLRPPTRRRSSGASGASPARSTHRCTANLWLVGGMRTWVGREGGTSQPCPQQEAAAPRGAGPLTA